MRALLLSPLVSQTYAGGLQIALQDLAHQLALRGWTVDCPVYPPNRPGMSAPPVDFQHTKLSALQRWPAWLRVRHRLPIDFRQAVSTLFMPASSLSLLSGYLEWIDAQLAEPEKYDVVLVCPDYNLPGPLSLALSRHPDVAVISLAGLAAELKSPWWPWAARMARRRAVLHASLFRRVQPSQIRLAILASRRWQALSVMAGVPERAARVIYFGVPLAPPLPRPAAPTGRLLWVGRLAPEKGLHLLLAALPAVRREFDNIRLTVVAGPGEAEYRLGIERQLHRLNLEACVDMRPPVERAALPALFGQHDALLFYSIFSEPVALVLMEAFAAGIPVAANHPDGAADLVRDNETCLCYWPNDARTLAGAVGRLLNDTALAPRLAATAGALVRSKYSLSGMGDAYDALLREFASASGRGLYP